jgi:hypothetical protein
MVILELDFVMRVISLAEFADDPNDIELVVISFVVPWDKVGFGINFHPNCAIFRDDIVEEASWP